MSVFKIQVDEHKCVGAGQCVLASPLVFDQRDSDGIVVLLQDEPSEALQASAKKAARICPAMAIRIQQE
jgi:ferredoxin